MVRVQVRWPYRHGCTISKLVQLRRCAMFPKGCAFQMAHTCTCMYIDGHLAFFQMNLQ